MSTPNRPKTPFQQRQEQRRINNLRSAIVEKVNNRSSQLKKIFMMFDLDQSGTIEYREFRKGLECMGFRLGDDDFNLFVSEIDLDGNGYIDFEEFARYLKMPGGQGARQEHLEDWNELANQRKKQFGNAQQQDHFIKPKTPDNIFSHDEGSNAPRYTAESAEAIRKRIEANNLRRMIKDKIMYKAHNIHKVFTLLDTDRNGYLDYSELKSGLERLGCAMSLEDFNWFIKQVDPDANGHVSFEEFSAYINEPEESMINGPEDRSITGRNLNNARSVELRRSHIPLEMGEPFSKIQQQMTPGQKSPNRGMNKDIERLRKRLLDKLYGKTHNLQSIFRQFDENKDGVVTYPEFKRGLHHLGLTDFTDHEFRTLVSIIDKNRDGTIDYNEFATTVKQMESPYGIEFNEQALRMEPEYAAVPRASDVSAPASVAAAPAAGVRSASKDYYGRKDTGESYSYHPTGTTVDPRLRAYSVDTMEAAGKRTGLKDRGYPNGR